MGNYECNCVLNWKRGQKKTAPFNATTNMLIFFMASFSCAYQAFSIFNAFEAPYYRQEKVLQFPGRRCAVNDPNLVPEEFVVEENINYCKDVSASEGVNADDETVKMSNLLSPPQDEEPSEVIQQGPHTFDPSPLTEEGEDIQLAAANDQAELMCWHYQLGHMGFPKLNQLAFNGKILKKLVKVLPPKCTECLFGVITKLPWQGKETKADHEVFIATKPGECVSVNQMPSTEMGFYVQLKGKFTKKHYKCVTVFVNHFSCLCFVHLQINNLLAETLATKFAFEQYVAKYRVKILHYHCNNWQFHDNAF
jgi:hypothetical protein